jgi:hypothetical protein
VYRLLVACVLGLLSVVAIGAPSYAAGAPVKLGNNANWNQRDTAVYVVSTLNVCRNHKGQPISNVLQRRFLATKYSVLADTKNQDLYFIEVKKDDGSVIGAYAYQMGWVRPQAITPALAHFGIKQAAGDMVSDYKSDPKALIATFSSTRPQ